MPTQHPTAHAGSPDQLLVITLGFTQSDRVRDYSSFTDGYQLGARQVAVTIAVDTQGIDLTGEDWAEAVFIATNDPNPPADPTSPLDRAAAAIRQAVADQVHFPLRSFSVGDTLTFGGVMLACQPTGWRALVDPPHADDDPTLGDREER